MLRLIHYVCMPSPLPRQDRWNGFAHYCSIDFGLPQITVGSAPALSVSWPAQRSLTLQPADSPSRLMRPSTPEAPAALLPPPPLRLLPGGVIQLPGGFISRCGPVPFTAHCKCLFKNGNQLLKFSCECWCGKAGTIEWRIRSDADNSVSCISLGRILKLQTLH